MVFQGPLAELVEQDKPSMVVIDLSEHFLGVRNLNTMLGKNRGGLLELFRRYSFVFAGVDLIEDDPVDVVFS